MTSVFPLTGTAIPTTTTSSWPEVNFDEGGQVTHRLRTRICRNREPIASGHVGPTDGWWQSPGPEITPPGVVVAVLEVLLAPGEQLVSWDCLVNGRPDRTVLAVAIDRRGTIPAIRAWKVVPVDEKIVEIDAASVVCDLSQI